MLYIMLYFSTYAVDFWIAFDYCEWKENGKKLILRNNSPGDDTHDTPKSVQKGR